MVECNQCDFKSVSKADVIKHKKMAHGVPYEYVCELCGKDFLNLRNLLYYHKPKCFGGEKTKWTPEPIPCDLCEFVSKKGKQGLSQHWKQHGDVDISLACHKCEFKTETIKSIEEHVRNHGEPPIACRLCTFSAHHRPILLAHFDTVHETVHETKCKFCSYETTSIMGLNLHMRRMHSHDRVDPVLSASICDRCGFVALDAIDLRRHIDENHGSQPINISPL